MRQPTHSIILLFVLVFNTACVIKVHGQQPTGPAKDTARIDTNLLQQVVVQGNKAAFQRSGDRLIVNVAGNKFFKTAANTFDILRKLPGVEVNGEGGLLVSGRYTPAIFINGKPSPMSELELQNYLASLSPDLIEAIELNANPAAQYDAEHKAIINIRLKQDATLGWKGNLTSSIQRNNWTYAENNFLLTYKTRKLTLTSRLGYTGGTKIHVYRALQNLASKNVQATRTKTPTSHNNYNVQIGADYELNKNQQLEVWLRAYQSNRAVRAHNTLHTMDSAKAKVLAYTYTDNYADPVQDNLAANLNYSLQWRKNQLNVITSIVDIQNRQQEDIQNRDVFSQQRYFYWKTDMQNDIRIHAAQADLSGVVGKGKWTAGAKVAYTTTLNNIRYDTLNKQQVFDLDSGRTNAFHYKEYITAGYIGYEYKWTKLTLNMGLRVEHTRTVADAITTKQLIKRNYLFWLPNISAAYSFSNQQQLQFSFNRRITRPGFAQLNPFRFYFSPLNYWEGNPMLQAATTTVLSIAYTQRMLTVTASVGREDDPLNRYPEYDSTTNILQYLGRNLPYNHFATVEAGLPIVLKPWWRMNHNVGLYYKKESTPYHDVNYLIPITEWAVNGNHTFTLPHGYTADLWYSYHSWGGNGLYRTRDYGSVDVGVQKTWWKGALNTRLNVYDIFHTSFTHLIFREKQLIDNRLWHWFGQRRVVVTLSYSFGRSTYKAKQATRNDEESRAM